jgi:hypothetical protein
VNDESPGEAKAPDQSASALSGPQLRFGRHIIALGLLVILATFAIAVVKWNDRNDVVTALAVVTSVVGTLVGTFFGVQAGSAERAELARQAVAFAAIADPEKAEGMLRALYPNGQGGGVTEKKP